MAGQPQIAPWLTFDVTRLEVTAEPSLPPTNIVRKAADFEITATFAGTGVIWTILELISDLPDVDVVGMATLSFEGIGADADEEDLDPLDVTLTVAPGDYNGTITVPANTLDEGIYIVGCYVQFEVRAGGNSVGIPGVIGHIVGLGDDQLKLSVY